MDYTWIWRLVLLLITITKKVADSKECDWEIWDDASQGRGVKRVEVACKNGQVAYHAPYGGLNVFIEGPEEEYQLCLQARSLQTAAVIMRVQNNIPTEKLFHLNETKDSKAVPKSVVCFPAKGPVLLFIEASIGAPITSEIILEYDIEANPRYGDDVCRPCSDEELLWNYCTSDFVAVGRMLEVKKHTADTVIPVSLDFVKQQSAKFFTESKDFPGKFQGEIYAPSKCDMHFGDEKFIFMGKHKFGRAHLRCAPTYNDYLELQRTSKLKGTLLCT